jgi:hypothetical protein
LDIEPGGGDTDTDGWTTGPAGPFRRRAHAGPHEKSSGHGTSLVRPSILLERFFERAVEEGGPGVRGGVDEPAAESGGEGEVAATVGPPSSTASVTIRIVSP